MNAALQLSMLRCARRTRRQDYNSGLEGALLNVRIVDALAHLQCPLRVRQSVHVAVLTLPVQPPQSPIQIPHHELRSRYPRLAVVCDLPRTFEVHMTSRGPLVDERLSYADAVIALAALPVRPSPRSPALVRDPDCDDILVKSASECRACCSAHHMIQ